MLQALLEHANMVTNTTLLVYSEQAIQSDYALGAPQASPNGNTMLLIYLEVPEQSMLQGLLIHPQVVTQRC